MRKQRSTIVRKESSRKYTKVLRTYNSLDPALSLPKFVKVGASKVIILKNNFGRGTNLTNSNPTILIGLSNLSGVVNSLTRP
jgi:hypothetical protein